MLKSADELYKITLINKLMIIKISIRHDKIDHFYTEL